VNISGEILLILLKAAFIIGLVYVSNRWLLPRLMHLIAMAKSQELFLMSILLICLAVALLTAQLGMSLAFGAFIAGLMVSESEYSHNAFGAIMPFKDTFTSFFFVSIGMLLDLSFVVDHITLVIASVLILLVVKYVIAAGTGIVLGHTFKGAILIGLALCQVGEFSFLLAKIGFNSNILNEFYYQLFLAVAVITMAQTPFLMQFSLPVTNALMRLPIPNALVTGLFPLKEVVVPALKDHLVIIGRDAIALKLSVMAKNNGIEHVSIVFDPATAKSKMADGDTVVYGDAVNEPILKKAHIETAEIIVISVGSIITTMAIIERIRHLNQQAQILIRTKHLYNVAPLYKLGADQVLPEELEMAIDFFNRILVKREVRRNDISRIIKNIRSMDLGIFSDRDPKHQPTIFDEFSTVSITSLTVEEGSEVENQSLSQLNLRKKIGITVLAVRRDEEIIQNPAPKMVFRSKDIAYVMGEPEQVRSAMALFSTEQEAPSKIPEDTRTETSA
jgi:CPA2 family monovalent cation:H+ antiporter-2